MKCLLLAIVLASLPVLPLRSPPSRKSTVLFNGKNFEAGRR